jgi:hypothetical protein
MRQITPPDTHPHVATITIDPADLDKVERMVDDARELRLLDIDDGTADQWTVRVGCASERVRDLFEDRWG